MRKRENMNVQKAKCDDLLHLIQLTNTPLTATGKEKNKTKEKKDNKSFLLSQEQILPKKKT